MTWHDRYRWTLGTIATYGTRATIALMMRLADYLKQQEKVYIEDALKRCDGSADQAAVMLGVPRRTLYYRMKKVGLLQPGDNRQR